MSERNDQVFAKFMVQLANKIIERRATLEIHIAGMSPVSQFVFSSVYTSPSSMNVVGFDPAGEAITRNDVTEEELKIMKAYFNGEDVLTTILSQER